MARSAYELERASPPDDKRAAILQAALELFAEHGFHGTTVPEIAERAEIAAGTIYRYFPSKEALVNAVYKHWKTELSTVLLQGIPLEAPFREQFHVFWDLLARFARENRVAFAFLELHHHAPYLDEESRECEETARDAARAFIVRAKRAQAIKDLPDEFLMAFVMGSFVGVLKASWAGLLKFDDQAVRLAERCCWEAIRR